MKKVVLLGSTGSIGRQALEIAAAYPDGVRIVGLAAGRDVVRSRTIHPQLPVFLYALSKSDGADQTLGFDTTRNGEPFAELGAVIQKDFAWRDQTGAPADPQAGNIPGGKRDVLRSATFTSIGGAGNLMDGFAVDSGSWIVANGVLQVTADSKGMDAASVFYVDQALPSYYEVLASLKVSRPTAGWKANAYLIFDYYGPKDFKFAGVDVALNRFVMGHRNAQGGGVLVRRALARSHLHWPVGEPWHSPLPRHEGAGRGRSHRLGRSHDSTGEPDLLHGTADVAR